MKVHGKKGSTIGGGVVSEVSWARLEPHLKDAFKIKTGEKITEVEPTNYGLRVKIEKI